MNDVQLATLLRAEIISGLSRMGVTAAVIANQQPTTQGRTTTATLYFSPISEQRYGWQYSSSKLTPELELDFVREYYSVQKLQREEAQWLRTTYQVVALAPQDPRDLSLPTAKDILRSASIIMGGQSFVQALMRDGVGIERITDIRNPYFVNDNGQFEASPSFDFTVTRKLAIIQEQAAIDSAAYNFTRV